MVYPRTLLQCDVDVAGDTLLCTRYRQRYFQPREMSPHYSVLRYTRMFNTFVAVYMHVPIHRDLNKNF